MKATLEFDLPDEQEQFDMSVRAVRFRLEVDDFANWLRNLIKHTDRADKATLEEVKCMLHDFVDFGD